MKGTAVEEEVGKAASTVATKKKPVKKDTRYNPFTDGRTPTSASQTTGP